MGPAQKNLGLAGPSYKGNPIDWRTLGGSGAKSADVVWYEYDYKILNSFPSKTSNTYENVPHKGSLEYYGRLLD